MELRDHLAIVKVLKHFNSMIFVACVCVRLTNLFVVNINSNRSRSSIGDQLDERLFFLNVYIKFGNNDSFIVFETSNLHFVEVNLNVSNFVF